MDEKFVYEPEVDTYLLYETLTKTLTTLNSSTPNSQTPVSILELGVGSGYIISNLQQKFSQHKFYGTDINKDAVEITKKLLPQADIRQGYLFEPFKEEKFDIIYFNTPYLPCETGEKFDDLTIKDRAIYGGKNGYETIIEFLKQVRNYLTPQGKIYLLFSSRTKPHVIEEYLEKNAFIYEKIASKEVFFEEIVVYEIKNKKEIEQLQKKGITHFSYLSRGKHSIVLEGFYNKELIVCKIQAKGYIEKEGIFLEKLQEYNFVPKLYFYTKNYIVMEKIEGMLLEDIYSHNFSKKQLITIFNNIFQASQTLDSLDMQKFEMLNPYKHIFIQKDLSVKFIDFERTIYSKNPKNTTQFIEYLRRKGQRLQKIGLIINTKKLETIAKTIKTQNKTISIEEFIE